MILILFFILLLWLFSKLRTSLYLIHWNILNFLFLLVSNFLWIQSDLRNWSKTMRRTLLVLDRLKFKILLIDASKRANIYNWWNSWGMNLIRWCIICERWSSIYILILNLISLWYFRMRSDWRGSILIENCCLLSILSMRRCLIIYTWILILWVILT